MACSDPQIGSIPSKYARAKQQTEESPIHIIITCYHKPLNH